MALLAGSLPAGSLPAWNYMYVWVEFVVGSHPCSEGFSPGTPVF